MLPLLLWLLWVLFFLPKEKIGYLVANSIIIVCFIIIDKQRGMTPELALKTA
jgi:hypothetical protein